MKTKKQDYIEEVNLTKQTIKSLTICSIKLDKVMKLAKLHGDTSGIGFANEK